MSDNELPECLLHDPKRRSRFYKCANCGEESVMSKRTKDSPYQVCIHCWAANDPDIKDTFLAWPNHFGKPMEGK